MKQLAPYVLRGDTAAARFCGFSSPHKFRVWAEEKGLRSPIAMRGRRNTYRVDDLRAALDAEIAADKPAKAQAMPKALTEART